MRTRWLCTATCLAATALILRGASLAQACPMCNQSIAEENLLPRAYMYSILFMLAMPATIFSGLGLSVWLKVRKYNAQHTAAQAAESPEGQPDPAEADAPLSEHGPRGGG